MRLATSFQAFLAVKREREFQDAKWGSIENRNSDIHRWCDFIEEELREVQEAIEAGDEEHALEEMIQVAALAIACIETHGVYERKELREDGRSNDLRGVMGESSGPDRDHDERSIEIQPGVAPDHGTRRGVAGEVEV